MLKRSQTGQNMILEKTFYRIAFNKRYTLIMHTKKRKYGFQIKTKKDYERINHSSTDFLLFCRISTTGLLWAYWSESQGSQLGLAHMISPQTCAWEPHYWADAQSKVL
eukprot:GHVR01090415.1.p1 GENE.GHVR01090415.1~~GHVR01090415.1.p1  ORF type:complete len:108 (+),score=4.23 GHVR01090415.1:267-590(+)